MRNRLGSKDGSKGKDLAARLPAPVPRRAAVATPDQVMRVLQYAINGTP